MINTNGKMKKLGWICIGFAMLLSILILIPPLKVESDIALPLIYFWTGTGMTLLFGNTAKHIIGEKVKGEK